MKRYRISEIASMLGISSSTLRFYEEKGLLKPHKNERSGYRMYDPVELNLLLRIRGYIRSDLSIEETARLLETEDIAQVADTFEEKSDELDRQIREAALRRDYLRHRAERLREAMAFAGAYRLCEGPAMYYLPFRTWKEILMDSGHMKITRHWASLKPFTESFLYMDVRKLSEGEAGMAGICIDKTYGDLLGVGQEEGVRMIPGYPLCAYTLVPAISMRGKELPAKPLLVNDHMQKLVQAIQADGYEPTGAAYGSTLHTQITDEYYYHLNEMWMPVRKK